jgi:hypothetical protein
LRAGPTGTPNPVASGLAVALSVTASDSAGRALSYQWTASCAAGLGGHGVFSDATAAAPTWTAPVNATGVSAPCTISVTVAVDGLTATGSCTQLVASNGTVTTFRRHFAEGATIPPFESRFALLNPGTLDASATMSFLRKDGQSFWHALTVPARARRTVDAKSVAGLESAEFSTTIESTEPLVADRTMTWGPGRDAAHAETGIAEAATTWYLAEGATHSGFDLFYTVQNPNAAPASLVVTYLRPGGLVPLEKTYAVPPATRFNIWVDLEEFPDGSGNRLLASADVSARLSSDLPIIVERSMYLSTAARTFRAGTNSAGVRAPATSWFLAEGATGPYFDLFVLVANPGSEDAHVEAALLLPGGGTVVKTYAVPASSRFTIWVDHEDARLADTAVSTTVRSTNGVPIIVERTMWWPGSVATWQEAHNSAGATTTGTMWALAEGASGGTDGAETYILVANTSAAAGRAKVTLLFEDGPAAERTFDLAPTSRTNVAVAAEFPEAAGRRFGAIVESLGETPAQIVVERAVYTSAGGVRWAAGTNALGTRLR